MLLVKRKVMDDAVQITLTLPRLCYETPIEEWTLATGVDEQWVKVSPQFLSMPKIDDVVLHRRILGVGMEVPLHCMVFHGRRRYRRWFFGIPLPRTRMERHLEVLVRPYNQIKDEWLQEIIVRPGEDPEDALQRSILSPRFQKGVPHPHSRHHVHPHRQYYPIHEGA